MHLAAGAFAQHLNRRKGFEGSVWEHPYQCTIIQDGQHLIRCLRYVDLNMVRAGVVDHPSQWRWCGYDELIGKRARYCLLDFDRLLESLDVANLADYRAMQEQGIEGVLQQRELKRQAEWTETLAVGSQEFVERVSGLYETRKKFVYAEAGIAANLATWTIHEDATSYNPFSGAK
jgi:putative transposase